MLAKNEMNVSTPRYGERESDHEALKKKIFEEQMEEKKRKEREAYEKQMLLDMVEREIKRRQEVELERIKLR